MNCKFVMIMSIMAGSLSLRLEIPSQSKEAKEKDKRVKRRTRKEARPERERKKEGMEKIELESAGDAQSEPMVMEKWTIVSANYGDREENISLRSLPRGVTGVLYTHHKFLDEETNGWKIVNELYHTWGNQVWSKNSTGGRHSWESIKDHRLDGVMAAKFYKMNAYLLPELQQTDRILWMDVHFLHSATPLNANLAADFSAHMHNSTWLISLHPSRTKVVQEVHAASQQVVTTTHVISVADQPLEAYEHQKQNGFLDNSGLYWCGVFVYDVHENQNLQALQAWWREVQDYTFRDQISFPYIIQKHNLPIQILQTEKMIELIEGAHRKIWIR